MIARSVLCRSTFNPHLGHDPWPLGPPFEDVRRHHESLDVYEPTPLHSVADLAGELGIGHLLVKDESRRFGLGAFKALGTSYAIARLLSELGQTHPAANSMVFATATDGNHGRAVAWAARRLEQQAVVYVPAHTSAPRIDAIRQEGARVVTVDGTYDDAVRNVARDAAAEGWQIVADVGYPGYLEIPIWIAVGYTTLFLEAEEQMDAWRLRAPSHVIVQAGVGGLASAAIWSYCHLMRRRHPQIVVVEPIDADCLLESISSPNGSITPGRGTQRSIMSGLNCGLPSHTAWPLIRNYVTYFLAVDDAFAETAVRRLARPTGNDPTIEAGESGAAGLAGLIALCTQNELSQDRAALGLDKESTVLVINTEGPTDPTSYARILSKP
jgi:diaminopropionate ammonia-lyase